MAQLRYAQSAYKTGYYPYPATYSYYPARTFPYGLKQKQVYPLLLVLVGIILVGYNFVKVEKIDADISRMAFASPDKEIAAVVFCDPCGAVEGEIVEAGKVLVIDTALNVRQMADLSGVKQIKLMGTIN